MSDIPPAERRELRAVIRAQFRVLRAEVAQRKAELEVEAAQHLVSRYRDEDKQLDDLNWRISQVVEEANRSIADLMKALGNEQDGGRWSRSVQLYSPVIRRQSENRKQLHAALEAGITAQVKSALLSLDRQEADLLKQLASDALESEAAQAFLAAIPSVGQLVPSSRLKEIEAAFDHQNQPS